jgi:probable addiction module antidote protein
MGTRNVRDTLNKHLRDPEVAAEYINQALASDDVAVILMAIRNVVDAQEGGISGVAEKSELGRESMYKMLSPRGNPKLSSLNALFHGLGLKLEVTPEVDESAPTFRKRKKDPDATRHT